MAGPIAATKKAATDVSGYDVSSSTTVCVLVGHERVGKSFQALGELAAALGLRRQLPQRVDQA